MKALPSRHDRRRSRGQSLVEYALILCFVSAVIVALFSTIQPHLQDIYSSIGFALNQTKPSPPPATAIDK
jgi:Flp pilus assembly pilin Flp